MKLIAIIPAFNEESTIGKVIKATSRFVDEILVINDGSTDNTTAMPKTPAQPSSTAS
jgi:glycosyltransferase involved in cell wall biosynthesis